MIRPYKPWSVPHFPKNGVPEAVMLSMKKFEGFLEPIDILADPEMMKQLKGSAQDVKAGRLIDLDEAF